MSGISVFARFKKDEELIGLSIEELEDKQFKGKSKQEAVEKALDNLKVQFDQ
jgi:DNA-binding transcriptional regulator of glucitol operon